MKNLEKGVCIVFVQDSCLVKGLKSNFHPGFISFSSDLKNYCDSCLYQNGKNEL